VNTQIKHPTRCNSQSQNLLLCRTDTAQHVSGITMPIIRSPSNCRRSLCFPYECGGGSVLSRGRFVSGETVCVGGVESYLSD
jgi:hypothetical protein